MDEVIRMLIGGIRPAIVRGQVLEKLDAGPGGAEDR